MLELGTTAPDFSLKTGDGKAFSLADQQIDKGLLVIFMCNHCPYVIHIRQKLVACIADYQRQGFAVVAVNSNDFEEYPADSPDKMVDDANTYNYTFPYLVDEKQDVAKAYKAACTPDLFLFDAHKKLVYRGQFDGARPGNNVPVTGQDLTAAVENLLAGRSISPVQRPSMGCNIKWKEGNAPPYFG